MKILVDCRCLNYPFLTGINAYTIRLLHCLSILKTTKPDLKITAMGLKSYRMRELMSQFPFLLDIFDRNITLAKYLNYQDSIVTQSKWFCKLLEVKLVFKNWFSENLNGNLEVFDYTILPQPRLLKLHPNTKLITIFHDIFSILDNQKQLPQSLIFNKRTCQTLVNRSHKVIAGSISTCQDINKTFFKQTNFTNPKIQLVYPALPNLQELQQTKYDTNFQESNLIDQISEKTIVESAKYNQNSQFKYANRSYILAISGIEPRKNWLNLILAHQYLQKKYNWSLSLILSGSIVDLKYYYKLLKLVKANKIKNVIWQINSSEVEKNQLIKHCEFVIYPSYYEGFGFPILEAFEFNKTVITSRISSLPEIGKDACIYANPFNYVSIANCIYLLNTDKQFKAKLEDNILKVKSQYSWNQMIEVLKKF